MRKPVLTILLVFGLLSVACGTNQHSSFSVAATQAVAPPSPTTLPQPTTTVTVATSIAPSTTVKPTPTTVPAPTTTVRATTATTAPAMTSDERDFGRVLVGGSAILINQNFSSLASRFTSMDGKDPSFQNLDGRWQVNAPVAVDVMVAGGGKVVAIVSVQWAHMPGGDLTVPGFTYGMSLADFHALYPESTSDALQGRPAYRRKTLNASFFAIGGGCTTGGIDAVAIVVPGYESIVAQLIQLGDCSQPDKD